MFFKLFSSRPILYSQMFSRPLKKGLHLESISDSAIFPPTSRYSLKKKGLYLESISHSAIFPQNSRCSLNQCSSNFFHRDPLCTASGGYFNLGARGKNFQKLMLSEKKTRSGFGLAYFSPKTKVFSKKKKKKGLHFDFISDFPIFLPKSRCSIKKKRSSLRFHFWFPYFIPKIKGFSKKKVFTSICCCISLFFSQNHGDL